MSEPRDNIAAEFELVEQTLALLEETMNRPTLERPEWMAIAGFIFNAYTGAENVLKNACRAKGIEPPGDSPSSHRDLLDLAREHGLLSANICARLDEYRAFRHFFVHGYGVMLDPAQLEPLAKNLATVFAGFRKSILRQLHD